MANRLGVMATVVLAGMAQAQTQNGPTQQQHETEPSKKQKHDVLLGTRTWRLGGHRRLPQLGIDGGSATSPRWAIYGLKGQWKVENHGSRHVEVEMDSNCVEDTTVVERAWSCGSHSSREYPLPTIQLPHPNYH